MALLQSVGSSDLRVLPTTATAVRWFLDRVGVPQRLEHIRAYVWRGGSLRFTLEPEGARPGSVAYALVASWDTASLQPFEPHGPPGLLPASSPVVEGRWARTPTGYRLQVGIDLAVPSAIEIRSELFHSCVPFVGRSNEQVDHALGTDLAAYVSAFLRTCEAVPAAMAAAAERLRACGL